MNKEKAVPGKNGKGLLSSQHIITTLQLKDKDKFLTLLYKGLSGYIEIREINKGKSKQSFFNYEQLLDYYPDTHKNIYIGMFTRKDKTSGTGSNCLESRVLWADFDNKTLSEVKGATEKLKPNIIISSGHGFHTYWLLDKAYTPKDILPVLKALNRAIGISDTRVVKTAAVMRLPASYNVKSEPVICEVISINETPYKLEQIKEPYPPETTRQTANIEITISEKPCIINILQGVNSGERNWATGRLTKEMQLKGFPNKKAYEVLREWNKRNDPPETPGKLYTDFQAYWRVDYKLLGCRLKDKDQQQILSKYCDCANCPFSGRIEFKLDNTVKINNRIFNYYKKLSGYDLIIYAVLLSESQGLNTSEIIREITLRRKSPLMEIRRVKTALGNLEKLGLIETINKPGYPIFAKAKNQGTYGTGYTLLSNGATNGAIHGNILPHEYKLYIVLLKYAFGKSKARPSLVTLGKDLGGIQYSSVSKIVKGLEQAGYIKREYTYTPKGNQKLIFRLKI